MKTKLLLNYIIILSLSLVIFGCDSSGQTIDKNSEEFDYIETTKKGIVYYKGVPFSGTLVEFFDKFDEISNTLDKNDKSQLTGKETYKEGKEDGVWETYYSNGQLRYKRTWKDGKEDGVWEDYYKNGQLEIKKTYKEGKLKY